MTLEETRHLCTFMWSTHPNAPKTLDTRYVAVAYFLVLHGWSQADCWDAVNRICMEQPAFVPSAYEIASRCRKTTSFKAHMTREYMSALTSFKDLQDAYNAAVDDRHACLPNSPEEAAAIEKMTRLYHRLADASTRLSEEKRRVQSLAEAAYDARENASALSDLKKLGMLGTAGVVDAQDKLPTP